MPCIVKFTSSVGAISYLGLRADNRQIQYQDDKGIPFNAARAHRFASESDARACAFQRDRDYREDPPDVDFIDVKTRARKL